MTRNDDTHPVSQDVHTPSLVDKVDGAVIERLQLALDHGVPCQKNDGKLYAALPHCVQQSEPGYVRHGPVQQRSVALEAAVQSIEKQRAAGKSRNHKSAVLQIR